MNKLLPCPFCGGEASFVQHSDNPDYVPGCQTEGCWCCLGAYIELEAITAWNRRSTQRWIPISARLPVEGETILTHAPGYYLSCTLSIYSHVVHPAYNGWWTSNVTHWMPLPEAPNPAMQATGNDGIEKSESPARG